jgi:uncharacterized protein (DUF433 family)
MELGALLLRKAVSAPAYSIADASRLAGLTPWRARRWLQGYEYSYIVGGDRQVRRGRMPPVVHRDTGARRTYASFLELVDLIIARKLLEKGVPLQKARKALDEVVELGGEPHFAREVFFTDGLNVYWDSTQSIIRLLSGGQTAFRKIVEDLYDKIEFDPVERLPRRYFPLGKRVPVAIDALVAFGRPALVGRRIPTANIYDLFKGEKEDYSTTSSWIGITNTEARAAVRFERQLAKVPS